MSCIVSAVCWLRQGKLSAFPREALDEEDGGVDPEELTEMAEDAMNERDEDAVSRARAAAEAMDPIVKEFGLDKYDEEECRPVISMETYYADPEADPNLKRSDEDGMDSETEETAVLEDDLFLLAATMDAEDEFSHLDVHIYEEADRNMFCHHDYTLPAFPLCVAYLEGNIAPQKAGSTAHAHRNIAAVGTMEPGIELWDLDVMDSIESIATLGGAAPEGGARGTGKKKRKAAALVAGSHTDSVITLSSNPVHRHVLASGSADKTIKLWDVNRLALVSTFSAVHSDKVQGVSWCPTDASILLTTGFDRRVAVLDARAAPTAPPALAWTLPDADPEAISWVPWHPGQVLVSSDNGVVRCYDAAAGVNSGAAQQGANLAPLWTLAAHEKAASAIAVTPSIPGLLVTGGLDKTISLWNITSSPSCIFSRNVNADVFCAEFNPDRPFVLGFGTSTGARVWDISEHKAVRATFGPAVAQLYRQRQQKMGDDGDDDDDGDQSKPKADSDGLFITMPPGQEVKTKKKSRKQLVAEAVAAAGVTFPVSLRSRRQRSLMFKRRMNSQRLQHKK